MIEENNEIVESDETKIDDAVKIINDIAEESVYKGMLKIGEFILKEFFDDDMNNVHSQNPYKDTSFQKLSEREDLTIKSSRLLQSVKVFTQKKLFDKNNVNYDSLSYSHLVRLLPFTLDKKKKWILLIQNKKMSVRKLEQKISESKTKRDKSIKTEAKKITTKLRHLDKNVSDFLLAYMNDGNHKRFKTIKKVDKDNIKEQIKEIKKRLNKVLEKFEQTT